MPSGNFDSNTPGVPAITGKNAGPSVPKYIPTSTNLGVIGESAFGTGVVGISSLAGSNLIDTPPTQGGVGVVGSNDQFNGTGVFGQANGDFGIGVFGEANGDAGIGIWGITDSGFGGVGSSSTGAGLSGNSGTGAGLAGYSNNVAVYAHNTSVQVVTTPILERGALRENFMAMSIFSAESLNLAAGTASIIRLILPRNTFPIRSSNQRI